MKRAPIVLLILFINLAIVNSSSAESQREAKHLFLPLLGSQQMQGEQVGITYFSSIYAFSLDTTFISSGSEFGDWSKNSHMFGLLYRYSPTQSLFMETSLSIHQDQETFGYEIEADYFGFSQRYQASVSRGNTTALNFDLGYKLHSPTKWLEAAWRGGVGIGWRSVKFIPPDLPGLDIQIDTDILDAKRMYIGRIGADFNVWKGDQLLASYSIFYARYIPVGRDVDPFLPGSMDSNPFGGFGWRLSFFPIWLE